VDVMPQRKGVKRGISSRSLLDRPASSPLSKPQATFPHELVLVLAIEASLDPAQPIKVNAAAAVAPYHPYHTSCKGLRGLQADRIAGEVENSSVRSEAETAAGSVEGFLIFFFSFLFGGLTCSSQVALQPAPPASMAIHNTQTADRPPPSHGPRPLMVVMVAIGAAGDPHHIRVISSSSPCSSYVCANSLPWPADELCCIRTVIPGSTTPTIPSRVVGKLMQCHAFRIIQAGASARNRG